MQDTALRVASRERDEKTQSINVQPGVLGEGGPGEGGGGRQEQLFAEGSSRGRGVESKDGEG